MHVASTLAVIITIAAAPSAQLANGVTVVDDMLVFHDQAHFDSVVQRIHEAEETRRQDGSYAAVLDDLEAELGFASLRFSLELEGWHTPSAVGTDEFARTISDPILTSLLNPDLEVRIGASYYRVGPDTTVEILDPTPSQLAMSRAGYPVGGPNVLLHPTEIESATPTEYRVLRDGRAERFEAEPPDSSSTSTQPLVLGTFGTGGASTGSGLLAWLGPKPGQKPTGGGSSGSLCTTGGCQKTKLDVKSYFQPQEWLVVGRVDVFNAIFYHSFTARTDASGGPFGLDYISFDEISVQGSVKLIRGNCGGGGAFKQEFDVVQNGSGSAVFNRSFPIGPKTLRMVSCCISSQHLAWVYGDYAAYLHQGKGHGATIPTYWVDPFLLTGMPPILHGSDASVGAKNYFIEVFPVASVGSPYDGQSAYFAQWFSGPVPAELDLTKHVPAWLQFTPGTYRVRMAVQNDCTNWNELTRWFTVFN
jgi:hypothetical protein